MKKLKFMNLSMSWGDVDTPNGTRMGLGKWVFSKTTGCKLINFRDCPKLSCVSWNEQLYQDIIIHRQVWYHFQSSSDSQYNNTMRGTITLSIVQWNYKAMCGGKQKLQLMNQLCRVNRVSSSNRVKHVPDWSCLLSHKTSFLALSSGWIFAPVIC